MAAILNWKWNNQRLGLVCVSLLGCRILEYEAVVVFDKAMFWSFHLCGFQDRVR